MIRYTKAYIKDLLDKYMDGTTSLEEEDILASYFRGKDIPQEWEDYRLMFQEIEAMKPQPRRNRQRIGWSVAAAVVAGIMYLAVPSEQEVSPEAQPLAAQTDTIATQPILQADTTSLRQIESKPIQSKKRRIRKPRPTIHDIDKAYALVAQAEQEQREVELQLAECRIEMIEAQLAAYGYIPVTQEDGTITYINEQKELIAYEE